MNYRQIYAIKEKYKKQLLETCPSLNNESGIYWFTRGENGFRYCYVGQAKHILDRLISHMQGYEQHIDLSIKKHGLIGFNNTMGWCVNYHNCPIQELNKKEQELIKTFANSGYQMLNKTSGSQGEGKFAIVDNQRKGYLQGKNDGKVATIKQIKVYFDKYLDVVVKQPTNKIKERKLKEFEELLKGEK